MAIAPPRAPRPMGGTPFDTVAIQVAEHPRLAANVLTVLQRERKSLVDNFVTVKAKDYSEYLNRLGQIEGLDIAISHVTAQAKLLG